MVAVTYKGLEMLVNRLRGATPSQAEPLNLGWDTGGYTAAKSDVAAFGEAPENRVAGASTVATTTTANDSYQVTGTIVATGTRTITGVLLSDTTTKPSGTDAVQAGSAVIGSNSGNTVNVATGSNFAINEYIQIRTEAMKITNVSGNTATVLRAQNGSAALTTIAQNDPVTRGNPPGITAVANGSLFLHGEHGATVLATGDSIAYTVTVTAS
jgi:hypothetical protein